MNIGEVFIALGFDVDDSKIKGFADKINGIQLSMLKLSGAAAGAVYGIEAFMRGSIDTATALANLHDATGENIENVEKWASAGHLANIAMSYNDVRASIEGVNQAISDVSMGKGDAGAFARLLTTPFGADGQLKKGTELLAEFRRNWERDEAYFADKGGRRAHLDALAAVGVNRGLQQALMEPQAKWNTDAANFVNTLADIERNKAVGQQIDTLIGKLQKLQAAFVAAYAPGIGKILDGVMPELQKLKDGFDVINETVLKMAGGIAAALAIAFYPLSAAAAAVGIILMGLHDLGEIKRVGWENFGTEAKEGFENVFYDMKKFMNGAKQGAMPNGKTLEDALDNQLYLYDGQGTRDKNNNWVAPAQNTVNQSNTFNVHGAGDPQATAAHIGHEVNRQNRDALGQLNGAQW